MRTTLEAAQKEHKKLMSKEVEVCIHISNVFGLCIIRHIPCGWDISTDALLHNIISMYNISMYIQEHIKGRSIQLHRTAFETLGLVLIGFAHIRGHYSLTSASSELHKLCQIWPKHLHPKSQMLRRKSSRSSVLLLCAPGTSHLSLCLDHSPCVRQQNRWCISSFSSVHTMSTKPASTSWSLNI